MPTVPSRRTRFAPSPSGFLHLGNARTALLNRLSAGSGVMLLRIEDTDADRTDPRHIQAIMEDLAWLGLEWEGDSESRPLRQSALSAAHDDALSRLLQLEHAYPCFCTPEQLAAERESMRRAGRPPRYSGRCAALSAAEGARRVNSGEAAAIRFRMPKQSLNFRDVIRGECRFSGGDIGDFILRRTNGGFSFFFANAVDDAEGGITHVLRGEDHLSNTPRQLAILRALEVSPPEYGHLPLLTGSAGPLSKRSGALSLGDLRARGFLPSAVVNYLARVGCSFAGDSPASVGELTESFSFSAVSKSSAVYDESHLFHWQKRVLSELSPEKRAEWFATAVPDMAKTPSFVSFCEAVSENVALYEDTQTWAEVVNAKSESLPISDEAAAAIKKVGVDFYALAVESVDEEMEWKMFCEKLSAAGYRGKNLFLPLRAALTGRNDGPVMPPLFRLIGEQSVRARLTRARNMAGE